MTSRVYRRTPQEQQEQRIATAVTASSHSAGWPHFDRHYNCLCTSGCCIGPGGCHCRDCSHRSHPEPDRAAAIERDIRLILGGRNPGLYVDGVKVP